MGAEQTFNYFTWMHRSTNGYNYLRAWGISMYGSNDGKNFIEIKSDIDIPYENNTDESVTGGSTMQVAEFGLGLKL